VAGEEYPPHAGNIVRTNLGRVAHRPAPEERRATLDRSLQFHGAKGWRIETRSEFQATIAKGKELNHVLHLILTLVTVGLWGIVWIALAIFGGQKRRMISVDEYGNLVEQNI
jgi:hypothetical protein